ncbi:MAG: hypothetical protein HQL40_12395 [Alphaproteobacteria bacterium]|nr:hypothetical protein [Alphaproteobacteria bacterium]
MSKILENALADAQALREAGAIDDATLRKIEGLCPPPPAKPSKPRRNGKSLR